jgi:Tfp pilus assembly protein PilP
MHFAKTLVLGTLLAGVAPGVLAQAKPADAANAKPATTPPAAAKTAPQAAKPTASTPPAKPAIQAPAKPAANVPVKPAAQAPGKPAARIPAKPAAKAASKPAVKAAAKKVVKPAPSAAGAAPPVESEAKVASRRDPFESLVGRQKAAADAAKNLPPGKAGLQVSTLRLDGVVKAPNGMIAVVTNPQSRTYFLREGDQLYDGRVEKIAMDGVSFHETGKDAFGKPVERQVNKRIYSSPGEQQ